MRIPAPAGISLGIRISSTTATLAALRASRTAATRSGWNRSLVVVISRIAPPSGLSLAFLALRIDGATSCRAESANDGGLTRIRGAPPGLSCHAGDRLTDHDDGHPGGQGVLDGAGQLLARPGRRDRRSGPGASVPRDGLAHELDLGLVPAASTDRCSPVSSSGRIRSRALSKPACVRAAVASIDASSGSWPRAAIISMLAHRAARDERVRRGRRRCPTLGLAPRHCSRPSIPAAGASRNRPSRTRPRPPPSSTTPV